MPRSRRRRSRRSPSRSTTSRRSPRRRASATKLKLFAAPHGQMPANARHLTVKINVGRNKLAMSRESAFMACASFGKVTECAESHNPSAAIGRAVARVGAKVADRPSSFAGLSGTRKRRRKSHR